MNVIEEGKNHNSWALPIYELNLNICVVASAPQQMSRFDS